MFKVSGNDTVSSDDVLNLRYCRIIWSLKASKGNWVHLVDIPLLIKGVIFGA